MRIINNNKQKGGFLIELMIGLVMSSLTVLGITTIYSQFETQKRTTVQLGGTIANAGIAMFPIQHNAKMAGYGIANEKILGCKVYAYNKVGDRNFNFSLTPVLITPGASQTESDKISFTYGNSQSTLLPVKLVSSSNANNANIKVENKAGFNPGDLVILYEAGKNCNLAQVSGVQGASAVVLRNTGNFDNPITGAKEDIQYNKPGGLDGGESYTENASVLNVGQPEIIEYSIENNQLIETSELSAERKVIVDNIVLLKARYGLDTNKDGTIDSWTNSIGAVTNYKFLRALKIAIISRTPSKEQTRNGACNVTTNSTFNWDSEVIDIDNISPDWGCYRYRFIQTVVPLRNMIWSLS